MPKFSLTDEQVGRVDRPYLFQVGLSRICLLDGLDIWVDFCHFDGTYYLCTKHAMDQARRDPKGRCYDCDQRGDQAKQHAVCRVLRYNVNDRGQPANAPDDPGLYSVRYIRLVGARLRDIQLTIQSVEDIRKRDLLVTCEDSKFQKIHTAIAPGEAWWLGKGRDIVLQAWKLSLAGELADMDGKLGAALNFDARVAAANANLQRNAGAAAAVNTRTTDMVAGLMGSAPPPFSQAAAAQAPLSEVYTKVAQQVAGSVTPPIEPNSTMPDRSELDAMLANLSKVR